jgi:hypothetical protein
MRFDVKNGPPTYRKVITQAFHEYINVFIKIFLDDFIIFNDLSTQLNPNKCAFMVFLKTILGFIIFNKVKVTDPNKVQALVNMPIPTTP